MLWSPLFPFALKWIKDIICHYKRPFVSLIGSFEEYNVEPTHHGECKRKTQGSQCLCVGNGWRIDKHKLHSPSKTINTI